jgi:hypothetical protein
MTVKTDVLFIPLNARRINNRMIRFSKRALAMSAFLKAEVRFLLAPLSEVGPAIAFEKTLIAAAPSGARFTIETEAQDLDRALIAGVERRKPDIVVLAVEPRLFFSTSVKMAPWQRTALERIAKPILVMPSNMDLQRFESILVPLKRLETRLNSALSFGLRLANNLRIPLDILHVRPMVAESPEDLSSLGDLGDAFHHEYPRLLDELVAGACPYSSIRERSALRSFFQVRGDTARQIFVMLRKKRRGLLIVEWKGNFAHGHAETVKAILNTSRYPVLLIKPAAEETSSLCLGGKPIAA